MMMSMLAATIDKAKPGWKRKNQPSVLQNIAKSTNIPIQVDTGDFRLLDRRCIEALHPRISGAIQKAIFSWIEYKKKGILYNRDPRLAGQTKWNYRTAQLSNRRNYQL